VAELACTASAGNPPRQRNQLPGGAGAGPDAQGFHRAFPVRFTSRGAPRVGNGDTKAGGAGFAAPG
jgi:hypothetical protein